jgi:hypothetical protein
MVIAQQQVSNVAKLLGGEAKYIICVERNTEHKKIVIEYDHKERTK